MQIGERQVRPNVGASGWFVAGSLAGAALLLFGMNVLDFTIQAVVSPIDVLQLAATVFLALYIPLRIQSFLEIRRSSKDLLNEQIRDFLDKIREINHAITECANSGVTSGLARNRIIYGFKAAGMRLSVLDGIIERDHGLLCQDSFRNLAGTYRSYWKAVTNGEVYANGPIDRDLWSAQEFRYVCLLSAGNDLIRSVSRS